ncbi:MAG: hypothetical protein QOF34_801, partial [Sphingomonadales bacterium]|nr:hypothetical protein [Sphingomonadales bacterium]
VQRFSVFHSLFGGRESRRFGPKVDWAVNWYSLSKNQLLGFSVSVRQKPFLTAVV